MSGNIGKSLLSLMSQLHHAYLETRFRQTIEKVEVEYNLDTHTKIIRVKFKNGHVAEGPECDARSEFFLAKCVMLHDLPMLPPD